MYGLILISVKMKTKEQIEETLKKIEDIDKQLVPDPENQQLKTERAVLVSKIDFLKNKK